MPNSGAFRSLLSGPFEFHERPEPMPGDLRMSWGIAILLLALRKSRGSKAAFQKLQFLAHAVRVPEGREDARALLAGQLRPSEVSVRVEPWLNRAVSFAHALKLVEVDKGKSVSLTIEGKKCAESLEGADLLSDEKKFLAEVAPKITEQLMNKVWRMEDLL